MQLLESLATPSNFTGNIERLVALLRRHCWEPPGVPHRQYIPPGPLPYSRLSLRQPVKVVSFENTKSPFVLAWIVAAQGSGEERTGWPTRRHRYLG